MVTGIFLTLIFEHFEHVHSDPVEDVDKLHPSQTGIMMVSTQKLPKGFNNANIYQHRRNSKKQTTTNPNNFVRTFHTQKKIIACFNSQALRLWVYSYFLKGKTEDVKSSHFI